MKVICSLKKNGVDYIVENQTVDDNNWINYGTLAGGMPGMGKKLVFVANPEQVIKYLDGHVFESTKAFIAAVKYLTEDD